MNKRTYKKLYKICKDDFGKTIYAGDTVELYMPHELRTTWESKVFWNMLDGAWVNAHPSHIKMDLGKDRDLRDYLNQKATPFYNGDDEIVEWKKGYCKKVKSVFHV